MVELLLVVGFVLITSAACSLFEAVLYSVPPTRIEMLVRDGRPSGRILRRMRQQVDRPISAILSLNTISNTGGGALAGALAAGAFGEPNVLYFSIAFTLVILLFAEVLPKTVGVVYSRQLAPLVAQPLGLLVIVFSPLVALTQLATNLIWKGHNEHRVSDEEVLALVGSGLRSGALKAHEAQVIKNVLSMETKTAREIMTPRPVAFTLAADTLADVAAVDENLTKYSRIPVFDADADDLVGVVHAIDILRTVSLNRANVRLDTIMRPVHFVIDTTALDELLRTFLERREHLAAVIDEFGGFAGIVTLEDVMEELLGREIVDESDQETDLRAYAHRLREETLRRKEGRR